MLRTPAYTKALAAYAAAQSVAEMGTVDEKLEYAVATNAAAWEVRETFAQVQARSLSGGMTMERIGKFWGGSEGAGEMRQAIGPHSREALSAAAGKGIADIRISFGAARDARSVLLNKRPQVPPPIPPGDGSAVSKVEAFVSATKDAVAETAKKIKRRVSGAAIIKPAHDAN